MTIGFDGFTVLNELDFSMKFGEMRFLICPNGAGKTTFFDAMTGKSKPDRGRIIFRAPSTSPATRSTSWLSWESAASSRPLPFSEA